MGQRLDLQTLLEAVLGSSNVYFQPPANVQMVYPCIVYNRDDINTLFADNAPYRLMKRYSVTVIDRDPDSLIHERVASLPLCLFNRFFTAGNLNHDVFILHF